MAFLWLTWGSAVVVLLVHVTPVIMESACDAYRGHPGVPGIPGTHGANGNNGPKGQKGDAGESGRPVKGSKGESGPKGPPGRPGLKGEMGIPGLTGALGPPGIKGAPSSVIVEQKSFFSYKRTDIQQPAKNRAITFDTAVLPDLDSNLAGDQLTNGIFHCSTKGVYFFTYHISAKTLVCLQLMKGTEAQISFCDTSESFLVTSGSVLLELNVGDQVSLQASETGLIALHNYADNIFTGFLLFPTK
ncbi:complement C1q subcomponent subunit B-like [Lampris incognitus]|uniref:complement C1q subcomponent subunit B-like n=1 Tax=Lampris incognitus TaxID=2546036 RepID=UPI0024B5A8A5|nr:complement C1q subcomponent subunit B-like [Lampris incognitus]